MKILIYMVGMLLFFGCESSGCDSSKNYKVEGVEFSMRKIPAGTGVASFLMAETEVT